MGTAVQIGDNSFQASGRSACGRDMGMAGRGTAAKRGEPIRSLRYGEQRVGVGRRLVPEGLLRTQLPAEPAGPRRPERGRSSVEGSGAICRLYCERRDASVLCRASETPRRVPVCEWNLVVERSERIRMARATWCTASSVSPNRSSSPGMIAPSRSLSALASRERAARGLFNVLLAAAASRQGA
jgi:hypothetical protein